MSKITIDVQHLKKVFTLPQKKAGLQGAVRALFKPEYQHKTAVDDISFQIKQGEVVGYIGVNGAGKSTTIKMLTGVLSPSSGSIQVLGRDPFQSRVANAKDIGVVFGQRSQLWWDLALIESLKLIGQMYDVPKERFNVLLEEFSETLDLKDLLSVPVRNMSLGQKMRSELAATLIHEPKVVYLDEPTIGLDIVAKQRIRDVIKKRSQQDGISVLLTTHDLGDIEELCHRVMIIDGGKIIYDGALSTIQNRFGTHRTIIFDTLTPFKVEEFTLPSGAEIQEVKEHQVILTFHRQHNSASQIAAQVMAQVEVSDFELREPDLASVVAQIYAGGLDP